MQKYIAIYLIRLNLNESIILGDVSIIEYSPNMNNVRTCVSGVDLCLDWSTLTRLPEQLTCHHQGQYKRKIRQARTVSWCGQGYSVNALLYV